MSTDTEVQTEAAAKTAPDFLADTAHDIETLSKAKALKLAAHLNDNIDSSYFKLGGVLKVIQTNGWFDGYESFDLFVFEKFGFKKRKAEYLMGIYDHLVTKQIPWEKVSALGWTKLKDIADRLTAENVDEWVAKATPLTVVELQAMLKSQLPSDGEASTSTTSDVAVLKFKLKNDQVETVNAALASVKAQIGTEHDNVALENLCAAHLAGVGHAVGTPANVDLKELFSKVGHDAVLTAFDAAFPDINITVAM